MSADRGKSLILGIDTIERWMWTRIAERLVILSETATSMLHTATDNSHCSNAKVYTRKHNANAGA